VRGDENDRNNRIEGVQFVLKRQSVHSGHPDVQNQAFRIRQRRRFEKRFTRRESFDPISERSQKGSSGISDGLVIINNRN
jgi:hypothetical protein